MERLDDTPINVVIPIGGVGSRFRKEGYRFPKPLINIQGRAMLFWIIDRLQFKSDDTLWVAISEDIQKDFDFDRMLKKEYPKMNIKTVLLHFDTRGAAETLYILTQYMSAEERLRKTVSIDCDTIYFCDVLSRVRSLPHATSATVYFHDDGDAPVYSYVELNKEGYIVAIKEKTAISRNANTGAYVFSSAQELHDQAAKSLDAGTKAGFMGEFYTSSIISDMLSQKKLFVGIQIEKSDFACVGTPTQLVAFQKTLSQDADLIKKRRFCFDLDSTLVTIPAIPGDYSSCGPIPENIQLVRKLKAAGHYIIIQTARRMQTHHGNVGAVIKDIGKVTLDQLEKFGVPYDEINFGKPHAHIYVDDLAVHARLDTFKEIGILRDDVENAPDTPTSTVTKSAELKKMVPARSFNTIQIMQNVVVKSSKHRSIFGEMFFYAHIPKDLQPHFPTLIELDFRPDTGFASVTTEKVDGISFSHLLLNRAITKGRFQQLMDSLTTLHRYKGDWRTDSPATITEKLATQFTEIAHPAVKEDLYANYLRKVKRRYNEFIDVYRSVASNHVQIANLIMGLLDEYETSDRAVHARVVHGDPVFSNVLLTAKGKVMLLDMRGQLGQKYSLEGDALYDLAKVYQVGVRVDAGVSVRGYDLHLMAPVGSGPLKEDDLEVLSSLEQTFWAHVAREYPEVRSKDIKVITPLHELPEKMARYMQLCQEILREC
ncbi:hypothetical protein HDU67_002741 [Dinochytrium kinnereticum]|nr:hypothetical protein HDU67_002741 [Dinochytrium kinnereticum]